MPGWHNATKELQDAGDLYVVGIIQEQHPDRARLFMQWKEMDWPVLVDSYNLLEVPYVPITLSLDEYGIVRKIHSPMQQPEDLEAFLAQTFEAPAADLGAAAPPDVAELEKATRSGSADAWREYGDGLAAWGGPGRFDGTIDAYSRAAELDSEDGWALFRLGVAYRMRYDSDDPYQEDFQDAVTHWLAALDLDPNQYIWRRRIQQYGPRLDKPYSFYDWVVEARTDIEARGGSPAPLVVEPGGAEFAKPVKTFASSEAGDEPDPRGRVLRDDGQFIAVETVTVPPSIEPGTSARFHVVFRPIVETKAHWNNEAEDLAFWIDPPRGWEVEQQYLSIAIPPEPVTQETRKLEVEVRAPEGAESGTVTIPAYALYYVCEDVNGICMYRRQDVGLEIEIRE